MRKHLGKYAGRLPDFVRDRRSADQVAGLSEEQLDTSESFNDKLSGVSRRDFLRVSKSYGLTATYMAAAGLGGVFSSEALAEKATKRIRTPARQESQAFKLKLGSVSGWDHNKVIRLGTYHFVRDLEERTDGEIQVDILGSNSVCAEQVCIQKTIQGVVDIGQSSTQNASSVAPWLNAIDFPYMFQSNGQLYHFMFNPKSEKLFREVYRKKYRMEVLFSLCEMRHLFMGLKWKDKPPITKIGDLAGTKNRVTNTQLGRIAMQLMDLNPVPVAWVETLDSLKNGLDRRYGNLDDSNNRVQHGAGRCAVCRPQVHPGRRPHCDQRAQARRSRIGTARRGHGSCLLCPAAGDVFQRGRPRHDQW